MSDSSSTSSVNPTPRAALPWATLTIAIAALALRFWPGAEASLGYERTQIAAAQYWRLWTAHVVHFSWSHLLINLLVFVPAGIWAERLVPDRLRVLLLLGPIVISAALYGLDPALLRYAGLSGVAAGVLVFLAVAQLRGGTPDRWFWRMVVLLVAAKIGLEYAMEQPTFARFSEPGMHAVPLAHISGVLAAVLILTGRRRRAHRA